MSDWQSRLNFELSRDWRRSALLAGLTLLTIVLLVRQFTGGADPAQARPEAEPTAQAAPTLPAVPTPRLDELGSADDGGRDRKVFVFVADPSRLPLALPRDPFAVDLARFPLDPAEQARAQPIQAADRQAPDPDVQEQQRRQAALDAVRAEASQLRLRSVLMADPPSAMIGGSVYRVGQKLAVVKDGEPFVVVRITPSSVTLERDGFDVVLTLR